ncbi:MAG: tetratricopeptide repeat protein [Candidatus Eisenbacteria sp.]|nr:tetratricopeptide repeat protein [Candidatus Eisenbacteria bacterium]
MRRRDFAGSVKRSAAERSSVSAVVRRAGRARSARAVVLVMLVALYPLLVGFGDSPEGRNRKGNRFYRDGRFDEALTEYRGAQVLAPELAALAFNAGNALFRKGELPDAIREYGNAALSDDVAMSSAALYNAGNAFLQAGQIDTAVEAFKGALKLDPDDQDAKHNLEVALGLLDQQQQEQQNQENQDQQDQENQEQEEQENQDQREQDQQDEEQENQDQREQDQQDEEQDQQAMSQEEAERLLDAIEDAEEELQAKLRATRAGKREKVDKDW